MSLFQNNLTDQHTKSKAKFFDFNNDMTNAYGDNDIIFKSKRKTIKENKKHMKLIYGGSDRKREKNRSDIINFTEQSFDDKNKINLTSKSIRTA